MSAGDYLAWEAAQSERYEFVDGEVLSAFMVDMKVQAQADSSYFYPHVVVTCSAADADSRQIKREPRLIVKALSSDAEAYDRGEKFGRYCQIPRLTEYALVDFGHRRVDGFRKQPDGLWVLHPFDAQTPVPLANVDVVIDADMLYAEIEGVGAKEEVQQEQKGGPWAGGPPHKR